MRRRCLSDRGRSEHSHFCQEVHSHSIEAKVAVTSLGYVANIVDIALSDLYCCVISYHKACVASDRSTMGVSLPKPPHHDDECTLRANEPLSP